MTCAHFASACLSATPTHLVARPAAAWVPITAVTAVRARLDVPSGIQPQCRRPHRSHSASQGQTAPAGSPAAPSRSSGVPACSLAMACRRRRRPSYPHPPTHLVTAGTHPRASRALDIPPPRRVHSRRHSRPRPPRRAKRRRYPASASPHIHLARHLAWPGAAARTRSATYAARVAPRALRPRARPQC